MDKDKIIPQIYDGFELITGEKYKETSEHFRLLVEVAQFYKERSISMDDLNDFILDYANELKPVLLNENFDWLRCPATIVLFYYLVNAEWTLRDNWWRSENDLKLIYIVFGYSFGNY